MEESSRPTIVEHAQRAAAQHPLEPAYVFLADGETLTAELNRSQLDARARAVGAALVANEAPGQPVLILCAAGLDYAISLLGCFYAGAIAVPAYPPTRTGLARTMPRIRAICDDCEPRVVLATRGMLELLRTDEGFSSLLAGAVLLAVDELPTQLQTDLNATQLEPVRPDMPALLQYTSGSTSSPKGVLVTHAQLAGNAAIMETSSSLGPNDRVLSWLPPYHDMGLVGGILQPVFSRCLGILMPPDAFLRRPARWLAAATTWRATGLLAPNFALDACVRRIGPDERTAFDLSAVRFVCIGAEPIRSETLERFTKAFAPNGLRPEALFPCYGMAEATLMISGSDVNAAPVVRTYSADALDGGRAEGIPAAATPVPVPLDVACAEPRERTLVSCGRAWLDSQLRIVNPETRIALAERCIGEVWVQTAGVAREYWRRSEESRHTFGAVIADTGEGPMLRTGDLGFLDRGELFITGRLKDLIIVRGRNHYPQDIERTVQTLDDALVLDAGAAFAIDSPSGEQLVVVQELDKRGGADPQELLGRIPDAIREAHDITPAAVVLIKRGSLAKTSSGKVQRSKARDAFLAGSLEVTASSRVPTSQAEPTQAEPTQAAPTQAESTGPMPPQLATSQSSPMQPAVARRTHEIESWLRTLIARKLGIAADEIDPRETVARYGVDSAMAAEIIEELQQWLVIRLDTTISYEHPTIAGLARAVAGMGAPRPAGARTVRPPRPHSNEREPIAIVGMACRFPGAPDLDAFWTLLSSGGDAIGQVPQDRWDADALYAAEPGTPGKICSKWGGFIEEIDRFDAEHFGISPHEAARMDPQQRLFLEVAWEALEDAGQAPHSLAGTRSGVFAGVCTSDFSMLYAGDLRLVDGDYGTGSAPSVVANRLSYFLDLKGPSETLDSACSSSLTALHHATSCLEQSDCDLAIVGGVNAVLAPEVSVSFSQIGALARDGRCKTFDQDADGFVRSEGAGVIVLKRLSDALRDRDRIYALVSGSAINHDGRSNGLMAPSAPAQRDVIERALTRAGITASDLDYVETHGVGAPVADAVEVNALGSLLTGRDPKAPLRIGSAKTNVGHLEAASGMVSVIKVALALSHEHLPRQLHCEKPLASIASLPLRVVREPEPWKRGVRPRYAGASAFGFGGANAHVVLREAPAGLPARSATTPTSRAYIARPQLLTLSARTPAALAASVRRLADRLEREPTLALEDMCFTLNTGRAVLGERLAILATDSDDLRERLLSVALSPRIPVRVARGSVKPSARLRVGLILSDHAAQADSLRSLLDGFGEQLAPAFDHCERTLRDLLDRPLLAALLDGAKEDRAALLARPSYAHAASVSIAYALCHWLRVLGIEPAVVYGSGGSEYAAAAAAGCIPWDQAITLATRRGILLEGLQQGATQRITLRDAKQALAALDSVALPPRVPLVSAMLGRALAIDEAPCSEHWTKHLLHAAQASADQAAVGISALLAEGCQTHLALAPQLDAQLPDPLALLRQDTGAECLVQTLGALFVRGADLDLLALAGSDARKISLPTYPFERERHWLDFPNRGLGHDASTSSTSQPARSGISADVFVERSISHPLIGRVRSSRPAKASGFIRKGSQPPTANDSAGGEND